MLTPYLYDNVIFLEPPKIINKSFHTDFDLNKEDVRYVRYYFLNNKYFNLKNLPKSTSRPNVNQYFRILENMKHKKWKQAYLYLLDIVPELFIEDETGC